MKKTIIYLAIFITILLIINISVFVINRYININFQRELFENLKQSKYISQKYIIIINKNATFLEDMVILLKDPKKRTISEIENRNIFISTHPFPTNIGIIYFGQSGYFPNCNIAKNTSINYEKVLIGDNACVYEKGNNIVIFLTLKSGNIISLSLYLNNKNRLDISDIKNIKLDMIRIAEDIYSL